MSRVSSRKLSQKAEHELLTQLAKVLTHIKKSDESAFFHALFTNEERMMLAKRIAVLVMLREELSTYRIIQILGMSSSTIIRMKRDYEAGKYDALVRVLGKSKKEREEFWKLVEVILRAGLPSRGKDRWKWLDKHFAP